MDEKVKNNKTEEKKPAVKGAELRNDNVAVNIERAPGCQIKLEVTILPKGAQAAYKKAIKTINKDASIPGFRKGKAPEAVIVKNYAPHVDKEWREIMVQTAFAEAVQLANLYPLNEKLIQKPLIKKIAKDEDSLIIFKFESAPEIPEIDPKTLIFNKVERKKVTQEQIDDYLDNLRHHHAVWEDVTDRPVQEGDYIEATVEDLDNPGHFLAKEARLEVAEGKMGEWMRQLVLGKNIKDSVEGTSEPSHDWDPEKEFKPTHCKITIDAIKTAILPEIDDELAKKVGLNTAEELKVKAEENLNAQADDQVKHKLREQVEGALFEHYPFDIPASILKTETQERVSSGSVGPKKEDEADEVYAARVDAKRAEIEERAKSALNMFFITRKIASDNNIQVSQEELVRELMMGVYSQSIFMDDSSDMDAVRSRIYVNLLTQKVKDFVLDNATIE